VVLALALPGCAAQQRELPPGLSDASALQLSLARFDYDLDLLLERFPDADVPESVTSTMVASRVAWSQAQMACLIEAGIRGVRATPAGYVVQGVNDPEQEAVARFVCRYRFTIDPRAEGALSAEQAGYAWDYLVQRVMPCMKRLGFEPSTPPTREDFIAYSERVRGAVRWSPYNGLDGEFSGPERDLVDRHCPPLPDDPYAVLNGTLAERLLAED
jgi:hypothetical protein